MNEESAAAVGEAAPGDGASVVVGEAAPGAVESAAPEMPSMTTAAPVPVPAVDQGGAMPILEFLQPADIVRTQYKTLTTDEESQVRHLKERGAELLRVLDGIGESRELSIAKIRIEEAVMWGVKHLTR